MALNSVTKKIMSKESVDVCRNSVPAMSQVKSIRQRTFSRAHDYVRRCQRLCLRVALLAIVLLAGAGLQADPIYVMTSGFTNSQVTLAGFNNAGDVCGQYLLTNGTMSVYLIRDGVFLDLYPTTPVPSANSARFNGISQRRGDGSVQIVGAVGQSDGFERGAVWTVAATGTYSVQVLTNLVLPPGTSAPGEQGTGEANAINSSGFIVGDGNSYLAGVGLSWSPPYTANPGEYFYSSGTSADGVNDQGTVLLNGVEYDHGDSNDRYTASILSNGGLIEIPYASQTTKVVEGIALSDSQVAGSAYFGTNDTTLPFIWNFGDPVITPLPSPAGMMPDSGEADSINASGDLVGLIHYYDHSINYGGYYQMLWKHSKNGYQPYVLNSLFVLEPMLSNTPSLNPYGAHINDRGDVALVTSDGLGRAQMRIYQPVTNGIVQMAQQFVSGYKPDGVVTASVVLQRADGYAGAVSVHYATSDGDAVAGQDYLPQGGSLTWNAGESGARNVTISLVTNLAYLANGKAFNLNLDSVTGAQFGLTNASIYIYEPYQTLAFTNLTDQLNGYYDVKGGASHVVVSLTRSGGIDGAMSFTNLSFNDGTAVAGVDYQPLTNTASFTWAPGQSGSYSLSIPLLGGNTSTNPLTFSLYAQGTIDSTNPVTAFAAVRILPQAQRSAVEWDTTSGPLAQSNLLKLVTFAEQGATIVIKSSTNWHDWNTVATIQCTNGVVRFNSAILTNVPVQVYEALMQ